MSFGASVRTLLGRFERPASTAYRSLFMSAEALALTISSLSQGPRILEVGVGDGLVAQHISECCPESSMLGIDLCIQPGRMFIGDSDRVSFRQQSVHDLLLEEPAPFDLVLLLDVLHHVPESERAGIVEACGRLTAPGGLFMVKESCRVFSPAYPFFVLADRWIGGDRAVSFLAVTEVEQLVLASVEGAIPIARHRIQPWGVNVLTAFRMAATASQK